MAIELKIRKLGNSVGVIFPKEFVKERHLKINEKVTIEVLKNSNLKSMFGALKGKGLKMSGQKFKDMVRKGWE